MIVRPSWLIGPKALRLSLLGHEPCVEKGCPSNVVEGIPLYYYYLNDDEM
jgi:hypothetical protein